MSTQTPGSNALVLTAGEAFIVKKLKKNAKSEMDRAAARVHLERDVWINQTGFCACAPNGDVKTLTTIEFGSCIIKSLDFRRINTIFMCKVMMRVM